MDVGRPSNFDRILKIYNKNVNNVRRDIISWSFQDDETRNAIEHTKDKFNYLSKMTPHKSH